VRVDEAGLSLLPMVAQTSAPQGQIPIVRVKRTRDHLSASETITPTGRLVMHLHERASKAEDVVRFVQMLVRTIPGTLLIVWDGSAIHRAHVVTALLASPMGTRVPVERVPGDAPEVNLHALGWSLLKRRERKNRWRRDATHLEQELVRANKRLRHRRGMLEHCFPHALAEVSLVRTRSGAF